MLVRAEQRQHEVLAYRRADAAKAIGCSDRHLDSFIKSGELPSCRIGVAVVILKDDLIAFVRARRTPAGTEVQP